MLVGTVQKLGILLQQLLKIVGQISVIRFVKLSYLYRETDLGLRLAVAFFLT